MKKGLLTAVLALICALAWSQGSVRVQAPELVGLGEQFNVTVTAEGESTPGKPVWDPGNDFQLVWGPQKVGSGTSVSIVNGKKTSSSQVTFIYILQSKTKGSFTLPSVTVNIGGEKVSSNQLHIDVADNAGSSSSSAAGSAQGQQQSRSSVQGRRTSNGNDAFLRFSISKSKVVVGEPIKATLKLFTTADIAGFEDAKLPTFNGFWSQETYSPKNIEFSREKVGDEIYLTAVLREYTLIPQQTGQVVIDPAEIVCVMNVRSSSATGSIFDSFFEEYQTVRRKAVSAGYTITVNPLPAGAPASFGGGVGEFGISSSVTTDSLKTHEAASLLLTVKGNGNIALVEAPKVVFPSDFEVYDVKQTENVDAGKLSGSKTFEYPFIPRSHGDFTIPPVEYSYYDYKKGKYVTIATQAIDITVSRGKEDGTVQAPVLSGISKKNVRDLANDIRYISVKKSSFHRNGALFAASPLYFILLLAVLLAAAVVYAVLKRVISMKGDTVMVKNRAAVKMARKRLAVAGEFLQKGLSSAFYEELHRALLGYVSDKLNIDLAEQSKDNICDQLEKSGVAGSVATGFIGLLDACEYARYSPDQGTESMKEHYSMAVDAITSIDSYMKNKGKKGSVAAVMATLALMFPAVANASAPADSLWQAGIEAYSAGDYSLALDSWEGIVHSGEESADLYYNIGNACYKLALPGKAIANYMRALRLEPSHSDAAYNLEFVKAQTVDQIDEIPDIFLKVWMKKAAGWCSANIWAVLSILLLAALCAFAMVYALGRRKAGRKFGFVAGSVCALFFLFSLCFMSIQKNEYLNAGKGVVTKAVCPAKSSPDTRDASELFVLHEGTVVTVIDEVGDWKCIQLPDGRKGWVENSRIEII